MKQQLQFQLNPVFSMTQTGILLATNWSLSSGLTGSFSLQFMLLIGSGLVALAWLVLSLTRWGQARPVWKCVVLSVAAHILLVGYAYRTRLMFHPSAVAQTESVRINLIDEEEMLDELASNPEEAARWDESSSSQPVPAAEELERPTLDRQVVLERTVDDKGSELNFDEKLEFSIPEVASIDTLPAALSVRSRDRELSELDDSAVNAQEIEIARRMVTPKAAEEIPDSVFEEPIDRQEIGAKPFSPLAKTREDSEFKDNTPQSFNGELVDDAARLPMTEQVLPMPGRAAQMIGVSNRYRIDQQGDGSRMTASQQRLGDGKPLPELYRLRAADNRLMVAQQRGGSIETEEAVQAALKWLAANQSPDGRWDPRLNQAGREAKVFGHDRQGAGSHADTGITALAVLAFMAGGSTHLEGPYQVNVQKGLEFLLSSQGRDGNLSGNAKLFARTYCHSMSLLALSEALALTGDSRLTQGVQRGVDFSVAAQNRVDGGWRYQPGDSGDMSQFGWQVLAMQSAVAGGIRVPRVTFDRMKLFLDACCSGAGNGLASYRPRQGVSTTMTAEALVCRFFLHESVGQETRNQATSRLLRELPSEQRMNLYYWYYGTMAMYQTGGDAWNRWNSQLKTTLVKTQSRGGKTAGSWEPNGLWAAYGGRVYSTAMSALCLEVYYRYLPMYEVAQAEAATDRVKPEAVERLSAGERQAARTVNRRKTY